MKKDGKKSKLGLGIVLAGLAAGVGATTVALLKKKKREEVYHEAELKAMNELDDLMAECDSENCADCSCAEECATAVQPEAVQTTFDDEMDEEDDEPIEDVTDDGADEEAEAEPEEKPEA